MDTSYVEFRKRGFWARDSNLSEWLTTLIDEMRVGVLSNDWLRPLIRHWEMQSEIDGGCMALELDSFLADDEKRGYVMSTADSALLKRSSDASKRIGHLFLARLKGEIKTDASSPIDYL